MFGNPPVQSSATQTKATVKLAMAAIPTSLKKLHEYHTGILVSFISTLTTRGRQKLHSGAWTRSRCRSLPSEGRRGRSTWASWISTWSWSDHRMLLHIIFFCCKNQTNQTFSCQTYPTRCQPQTYQQQILLNCQCHYYWDCNPLFAGFNSISGISAYI